MPVCPSGDVSMSGGKGGETKSNLNQCQKRKGTSKLLFMLSVSNCISDPVSGELRTAVLVISFVKGLKERRECVGFDLIVFSVLCCWNKEGPAE